MTTSTGSDDVEDLRRELAALKGQLDSERTARSARVRRVVAGVLVVLAVVATTTSLLAVWTFRTLNDTELFVDRVGSIIEEPAVAQAIGDRAAAELVDALQLQDRIAEVLPDRAALVAGPITTATQDYLADAATALVQTEQFQAAWDAALAEGHRISVGILSGTDTAAIENSDGIIVLNITPVINALLAEGAGFLSDLLNREIDPPSVTPENIEAAVAALEEQLGTELPGDFGTITLFASDDLAAAQAAYSSATTAIWLAPLVALVLIALALAVSTRRLRTLAAIVVGTALLLLLVRLLLAPIQESLAASVTDQGLAGAVDAAFASVTSSLLSAITLVLVLGVIAALGLFVGGDSAPARAGRSALGHTPGLAARFPGGFLIGGAAAALALLAIIPGRSWGQVLVVLLVYAAYALAVVLAPRATAERAAAEEEIDAAAPGTGLR